MRSFTVKQIKTKTSTNKTLVVNSGSPSGAASKAFNVFCKDKKVCTSTLAVTENKVNSKTFTYKVVRKMDPRTIMFAGKPIVFKYSTTVKAMK